ncbi:hypothetical protein ATANTOWER_006862 [Ataeniobius toweri]|uniref:Uncharacterized protein n=1 Tax=Ataeniobius toweri TaxID=208326 RepID=A0ABU7A4T1_9TELE|nr:hypothetical protein [Ataeniobius toweri]
MVESSICCSSFHLISPSSLFVIPPNLPQDFHCFPLDPSHRYYAHFSSLVNPDLCLCSTTWSGDLSKVYPAYLPMTAGHRDQGPPATWY